VGSKLPHAAQIAVLVLGASTAAADPTADELAKQGADAYAAGHYDDAVTALQKAYALDPKKETLFALAQSERLGGHCPAAVEHYKLLLSQLNDLESSKLIEGNVALCEKTEALKKPDAPPPAPAQPAAVKTVVRVEHSSDRLATMSFAAGMLALGAGGGLFVASSNARDDAKTADTLAAHNQLDSRADTERGASYIAFGVGAAAVGYAIFRWVRGGDEDGAAVAVTPRAHGAAVGLTLRW